MDVETKAIFIEKLHKLRTVLWPADELLDSRALESAYYQFPDKGDSFLDIWIQSRRRLRQLLDRPGHTDATDVHPSRMRPYFIYVHALNTVRMSLGALAPPLYYARGNAAMLFGGLGYMYAKELVRAIDAAGVNLLPSGALVESSWIGKGAVDEYNKRVFNCLEAADIFPEVPALEVAYEAYKTTTGSERRPLSTELTEEQEFFVMLCRIACASSSADNIHGGDCNKAVSNFKPFAEAFRCGEGATMNPSTKCRFFG
ncbi:hypothetical protein HPB48_014908 [Haemaphysalis longicornis]|uniref:Peptidase M13 C-terminal domain-containing protein n=1 Tax=Haemaphysalis longicornis TaxID=44386 RepID=A0A9J6GVB2_HAELO|nr:hypothetical protein HPB48_014908 [Haemaphysalis longicornis]